MLKYKMYIIGIVGMCLLAGCGDSNIEQNIRQEQTVPGAETEKNADDAAEDYETLNADDAAGDYETLNADDAAENHEPFNTDDAAGGYETLNADNAAESYETLNTGDLAESLEPSGERTDMYDPVLEEYRDMVQNDFYMDLLDSDTWDSSFGEHIGLEIRTRRKAVFYAFYDIDGNGTKELIIAGGEDGVGVANPAFSPCNYDLYGYDGTNVIHIFPDMEFGYRTNFSLCENGMIEVYYSSSAAESGVDFYKIGSDGFTPELADSFSTVWHLEGEESVCTYFQKGNEITEEEYKTNMQNCAVTLTAGLDWVEIY